MLTRERVNDTFLFGIGSAGTSVLRSMTTYPFSYMGVAEALLEASTSFNPSTNATLKSFFETRPVIFTSVNANRYAD